LRSPRTGRFSLSRTSDCLGTIWPWSRGLNAGAL
jgi:hypothetical protein